MVPRALNCLLKTLLEALSAVSWNARRTDDNKADGSPCFSGHRTPTEAYCAWDEQLTADCMSHQVLKGGNAYCLFLA